MTEKSLELRLFLFSLKEKAMAWLLSPQLGTNTNWVDLAEFFIGNSTQSRRLLLYVKPLTLFINYKGRHFSRTLRDLRTFCLSVLTMDLKKIV